VQVNKNLQGEFIPAKNKLEAVARISNLTKSGPETLGPGSKERKSVVINLAQGMGLATNDGETKQELAKRIVEVVDRKWTQDCESIGQTLTLFGLNLLLQSGTEYFASRISSSSLLELTLNEEILRISEVVVEMTPRQMDGKLAINEMKEAEFSQWRATEWQGFYFEFKVRPELINKLGGGPRKIGSTDFDYALARTWDMKVHSSLTRHGKESASNCILNDAESMRMAASQSGFGLIILSGEPIYDLDFTRWHKSFRSNSKEEPKKLLKKSFKATRIDFFFVPSLQRLEEALEKSELKLFKQGRQPSGEARKVKYSMNLKKSLMSDLHIFGADL
jgi:hypothetical protein